MAQIGTFTAKDGAYTGTIRTMTINVKAQLVPNEDKASESAPDFRLYAGGAELGAAWRQVAEDAGVPCCEIEVVCSDVALHERRHDREHGVHAAPGAVRDRRSRNRRTAVATRFRTGQEAGHGEVVDVVARRLRQRTGLAPASHPPVDQAHRPISGTASLGSRSLT